MGFVTFASFDDTLSISHKKNIDKSFFSPEISLRTAVTFFMVRSVYLKLTLYKIRQSLAPRWPLNSSTFRTEENKQDKYPTVNYKDNAAPVVKNHFVLKF